MPDHRYIEGGSEELLNLDERTGAEERLWWERNRKFLLFGSRLTRCPGKVSDSSVRLRASSGFLD